MLTTPEQRRVNLQATSTDFVAFRNSAQTRELVALLDAMIDQYHADLASVKPERLLYVQGALAQVMALRALACSDSLHLSPLI
jgi:hypothetical protein